MNIVITGATGYIGRRLIAHLRDHRITALVRDERAQLPDVDRAKHYDVKLVKADLETPGPWCDALAGADAIVHLAGESVGARRWDAHVKQLIRDSRVETTRTIVEAIASAPPKVLITASGVDYYNYADDDPDFDDDEVTEANPAADTFLGRLCRDWEAEASNAEAYGVRVVSMRTGMVIGPFSESMAKLRRPFELFAGGRLGSGRQWVSWIHVDDVVSAYATALTDERYRGPINLVTQSVRNRDFARELGKVMHRPTWLPVPAFAIRAVVGDFAESVLHGRRVVPAKLHELGFMWRYPTLAKALEASL